MALSAIQLPIIRKHLPTINAAIDSAAPGSFQAVDCGTFSQKNLPGLRHRVVIDTSTGYFTATFEMTVKSAQLFQVNGKAYRLGVPGKTYRWSVYGKLTQQGPPSAQIAGFASGIRAELVETE